MIDTFSAKPEGKVLVVQFQGMYTLIGEYRKGKKPKLIDMAMGSFHGIVNDLKSQGYEVKIIK